jgi:heterotetrameric sarcosine oxidase gamma subunit
MTRRENGSVTELPRQTALRGGGIERPGLAVSEAAEEELLRLQLFSRDSAGLERAGGALGRPLPAPGVVRVIDGLRMAGTGPGSWLCLLPRGEEAARAAALRAALAGMTHTVLDATDALVQLRIAGAWRATLLARGTSLDLDRLRVGSCAVTRFAGVTAVLLPAGDSVTLVACRSLAAYLRDWCDAMSVDCC